MKFQKGILDDIAKSEPRPAAVEAPKPEPRPKPAPVLGEVDKNRLFETQEELKGSSQNYLKIFAVVIVLIVIAAGAVFYLTLPGIGDQVHAPRGAEEAVRENFSSVQKRSATDVVFFQCDGFYWARVGVETRNDIANPVLKIGTYTARVTPAGDNWSVTAQPAADGGTPCQ